MSWCSSFEGCIIEMTRTKLHNFICRQGTISLLKDVKVKQLENRLLYGSGYTDSGFVFTDELGQHVRPQVVYRDFKIIVTQIGSPATRFHDLRHSYAVAAIKSGNDIKMPVGEPDKLLEALREGALTREELAISVKRLLEMILWLE